MTLLYFWLVNSKLICTENKSVNEQRKGDGFPSFVSGFTEVYNTINVKRFFFFFTVAKSSHDLQKGHLCTLSKNLDHLS